jgi:glycosyltransferase involved in cell wall biosynthesis
MKIIIVSLDNSKIVKIGGKHIHQELLEEALLKIGHSVIAIYPKVKKYSIYNIYLKIMEKLRIFSRFIVFKKNIEKKLNALSTQVKMQIDMSVNLVLAQDVIAAIAAYKAIKTKKINVPIILTLHGYFGYEAINYCYFNEKEKIEVLNFCMLKEKKALNLSKGIIAVDSRIKKYVEQIFKVYNVSVIYNSINTNIFKPIDDNEKSRIRKSIGLEKNKTILLIARRMVKKNGVIYAIRAFNELYKNNKNYKLLILGNGPEEFNLKQEVFKYKLKESVVFLGAISHDDIDIYYKISDYVIMPSICSDNIEEATSLSMLEGMSCGKIVIATCIGGMKEIILHKTNGWLVKEKNANQIATAIMYIERNKELKKKMENAAALYIHNKHDYINHAKRYINECCEFINK